MKCNDIFVINVIVLIYFIKCSIVATLRPTWFFATTHRWKTQCTLEQTPSSQPRGLSVSLYLQVLCQLHTAVPVSREAVRGSQARRPPPQMWHLSVQRSRCHPRVSIAPSERLHGPAAFWKTRRQKKNESASSPRDSMKWLTVGFPLAGRSSRLAHPNPGRKFFRTPWEPTRWTPVRWWNTLILL